MAFAYEQSSACEKISSCSFAYEKLSSTLGSSIICLYLNGDMQTICIVYDLSMRNSTIVNHL
jgi:hypothetical protein